MSTPTIYRGVKVGTIEYLTHLNDSVEISIEPSSDKVKDGQTLNSKYDVSFSVTVYDEAVLNDGNIHTDGTALPTLTSFTLLGKSGSKDVEVGGVIVNCNKVYDQNRLAYTLSGSKMAVSLADATTDTPVT